MTFPASQQTTGPRKAVVQVYFANRNMTLTYYNDQFDLHCGDIVYVDGKLEGLRGRVTEINYNFRINISDYQRVIAVVDTSVHGQFFMAGSHFLTFDRAALPSNKVTTWFKAPPKENVEIVSSHDDTMFLLADLKGMKIRTEIAERGHNYYVENKVKYISIDGTIGYAIVEGHKSYEVEFEYCDGAISRLTCPCFCIGSCKHQFAVMLQLREALEIIEKHYTSEYNQSGYFAAIDKGTLLSFAVGSKDTGSFIL